MRNILQYSLFAKDACMCELVGALSLSLTHTHIICLWLYPLPYPIAYRHVCLDCLPYFLVICYLSLLVIVCLSVLIRCCSLRLCSHFFLQKVHHAGQPMPGEEQDDIVMTSTQCNLLNVTCPLSGKPVTELAEPVRR